MIGPERPLCDAALVAQMQKVAAHLRLADIAGPELDQVSDTREVEPSAGERQRGHAPLPL